MRSRAVRPSVEQAGDIHRRPLEQVPIPKYDAADARHTELVRLRRHGHEIAPGIKCNATRCRAGYPQGTAEVMPRIEELTVEILADV